MPSLCKRRSCIPRSQTTCQSLHLVKAELEVNLGLLTLAARSQNCRRVSPFPSPRLAWASQFRNSESNCPRLKFIRNTPSWSSNSRQASPPSSSSFIWQVGRITESHCNWGSVRATLEEGGTPHQRTDRWVSESAFVLQVTKDVYPSQHSPSLRPSSISASLSSCTLGALENADTQTPTQINDNKISWDGARHRYFFPPLVISFTQGGVYASHYSLHLFHPLPPHHPPPMSGSLFSMSVSPLLWN